MDKSGSFWTIISVLAANGCGGWSDPEVVEELALGSPNYYAVPRVSAERGRAGVVYGWRGPVGTSGQVSDTTTEVHANVFESALPPPAVYLNHTDSDGHDVTVSGNGEVTVVYNTSGGDMRSVQNASGMWVSPVIISEGGGRPRLASNQAGNVIAVWPDGNLARAAYLRTITEPGAPVGWEPPITLNDGTATKVDSVNIAMNSRGDAMAVWCETTPSGARVVARGRDAALGWDAKGIPLADVPECLGPFRDFWRFGSMTTVDVGISDSGRATVAWADGDVKMAQHLPGSIWGAPTTVVEAGGIENLQLGVGRTGGVAVAWYTRAAEIAASIFLGGATGFGPIEILAITPNPSLAVGVDDEGGGMVAFVDGVAKVARFDASGALMATDNVGQAGDYEVDLSVRPNGEAFLAIGHAQRAVHLSKYSP